MASRDLKDLIKETRDKAQIVQKACREAAGFELLIYCTLRRLEEQARLFRQSRSRAEIEIKKDKFRSRGFAFLADVLESVGPCYGRHVTNAGPGESWHNFAQAWDAVPLINGKPVWSYFDAQEYWDAYGEAVRQVGMYWAGDWISFREYPHAQFRPGGNPLKNHSPEEVKATFVEHKLIDPNLIA
jgi:peptidoglycan L-alanyl-D-glutamate endopeptidase CwlK